MSKTASLRGLSVLVTGAASGIGRQLARDLFWNERCELLLLDTDFAGLETLRDELNPEDSAELPRISLHACDIASAAGVEAFLSQIAPRPLDVLVNNAGVTYLGPFESMAPEDFERVVGVNLLGAARLTRAVLPKLLQSRRAFIVNVASMAGLIGAPGLCAYTASKFGLVGFSQALAAELDGRVGVCAVCPTFVRTNLAGNVLLPRRSAEGERPSRDGTLDKLLSIVGCDPRRVSRAVIGAVKEDRRLVLVNPDAHFLYYMNRFFPGLSRMLVSKSYDKLRRLGVLEP